MVNGAFMRLGNAWEADMLKIALAVLAFCMLGAPLVEAALTRRATAELRQTTSVPALESLEGQGTPPIVLASLPQG